jgi:serine/threonine protein kinase
VYTIFSVFFFWLYIDAVTLNSKWLLKLISYFLTLQGILQDGGEIAVKHLTTNSQQNIDEFLNEVVLITNMKHKNLVKLKGCCLMGGGGAKKRLLVYEFVDNNNLAETIFENKGGHNVDWLMRKNICLGVARGLTYLHEDAQPRIIHRDIKAPNILLDKHFNAKIADFGLARLFPDTSTHISTFHIAGTIGYVAPEYASRGQLSEKVDVFSFGVLVLEIVSGRKNIEPNLNEDQSYLLEWVWKLYEEAKLLEIVDPKLNTHNHEKDIIHVINIGLSCVQSIASNRPSMARIVAMLQGDDMEIEVVIKENPLRTIEYESLSTTINSSFMSKSMLK